jgi:O-acetyl-ADP-ribose deacetylase (regulator of RNase III)
MITYTKGDILRDESEAIVNTVNCVGIMGRGIALQFRNAYPENFKAYERACKREEVQPGRMFVHETGDLAPRYIINFPTKRHWRGKSRMEDIDSGLRALVAVLRGERDPLHRASAAREWSRRIALAGGEGADRLGLGRTGRGEGDDLRTGWGS